MAFVKGQCTAFKINGSQIALPCKAINTAYKNGRTSFGFVTSEGISFSGIKDIQPEVEYYKLKINRAVVTKGDKSIDKPASGNCVVNGDIAVKASISCNVIVDGKDNYEVEFKSVGMAEIASGDKKPNNLKENIETAIAEFDRIYQAQGIDAVEVFLEVCYSDAGMPNDLNSIIRCAAIDYAGSWLDEMVANSRGTHQRAYFVEYRTIRRVREALVKIGVNKPDDIYKISRVAKGGAIKTLREYMSGRRS